MFRNLSQLVVMVENGFMDALVSSGLVGDVSEELGKARPCSVALAPENVRIERRVEE